MSDGPDDPYAAPQYHDGPLVSIPPDVRNWAMIAHLSGLAKYTGIPFANVIAPLIVWQLKKDTHPLLDDQG